MNRLAFWRAAAVLPALVLAAGCGRPAAPPPAVIDAPAERTPGKPWFTDVTAAAGIDFVHYDSATPMHYIFDTMGAGVGFIDYDADGWLDLFCVQGGPVKGGGKPGMPTHKLYRNNGDGTFADMTEKVGLAQSGYGMGCAVGDFDNDGYDDLVVTYINGITLYANRPDGHGGRRFVDITKAAKIVNPHWCTSCAWGDADGDGLLDLYVCNYVEVDVTNYVPCVNADLGQRFGCPPTSFPALAHTLFHNNGDGTFTDVSAAAGIAAAKPAGGLAVAFADLDGDGKTDIYVANDMQPAYLFQNLGGGKFTDRGLLSGAAFMLGGRFIAGMGIALGDIDGSGRPSLIVSNFQNEPTMVFLNRGKMAFQEWSHPSGLGPATMKTLGFGIELFDADLDGNLDLALANGHVTRNSQAVYKAPYEQEAQLFLGDGKAKFTEVTREAGPYFRERHVGRGLAVGDFDNDGRPDLVFSNNGGPVKLLRNETETGRHWLRVELIGDGKKSNRNAVGAKIEIDVGGRTLSRWVTGGGSYLSASDRRVLVGLGDNTTAGRVRVTWPSGKVQEFRDVAGDAGWRLREGEEPTRTR